CGEGSLAADCDEGVNACLSHDFAHPVGSAVLERVRAARADDRAAEFGDAPDVVPCERLVVAVNDTPPAALEADELEGVHRDAREDDPADDRVESGRVSSAGENADRHESS